MTDTKELRDFSDYLYNLKIFSENDHDNSQFCNLIQKSPCGKFQCWQNHLESCKAGANKKKEMSYSCHVGFKKMVAPIRAGNRHIANIYLEKPCVSRQSDLNKIYTRLGLQKSGVRIDTLRLAYESLRKDSASDENRVKDLLKFVADLISEKITTEVTLHIIHDISKSIAPVQDLHEILTPFFKHALRLVEYDMACVWLMNTDSRNYLDLIAANWPKQPENNIIQDGKHISLDAGLVGKAAQQEEKVLLKKNEGYKVLYGCPYVGRRQPDGCFRNGLL